MVLTLGYGCRWRWRGNRGRGMKIRMRARGLYWPAYLPQSIPLIAQTPQIAAHYQIRDENIVDEIYSLLPKMNCGACGFPTCRDCAEAIAAGIAPPNACRIVGNNIAPKVQEILAKRNV